MAAAEEEEATAEAPTNAQRGGRGSSRRKRDRGDETSCEAGDQGAELVGKFVEVWWEGDAAYYIGEVTEYDEVLGEHTVIYVDDGIVEKLSLDPTQRDAARTSSSPRRARAPRRPAGRLARSGSSPPRAARALPSLPQQLPPCAASGGAPAEHRIRRRRRPPPPASTSPRLPRRRRHPRRRGA